MGPTAVQQFRAALSLMGHKRTNHRGPKSTFVRFGPKADKRGDGWIVRYVPQATLHVWYEMKEATN
jgi:hypothetical protein